jgi:uncharacterized protein (TIGR02421 family)
MGIRLAPVPPPPDCSLPDDAPVIRRLSDRLLAAARPLRILEAVQWPTAVERTFLAAGGRDLPPVTAASYSPLTFDPPEKLRELAAVERDVWNQLGRHDPAARLLLKAVGEYKLVVRLLAARGTPEFADLSRDLFGSTTGESWVGEFSLFLTTHLEHQLEAASDDPAVLTAGEAMTELAARLAAYFGREVVRVVPAAALAADACAAGAALKLRSNARFAAADVRMLEVHEGWVHLGTTLNGRSQPVLTLLSRGLPSATRTQEGLAVFLEFLTGSAHPGRIRKHLLRLRGLAMAEAGAEFRDVYRHFLAATDRPADAYHAAMRLFRGSLPAGGAFTKDLSYARGLLDVFRFVRGETLAGDGGRVALLFCGKTCLDDLPLVAELARQGLIVSPRYVPTIVRDLLVLADHLETLPGMRPLAAVA